MLLATVKKNHAFRMRSLGRSIASGNVDNDAFDAFHRNGNDSSRNVYPSGGQTVLAVECPDDLADTT